jgi:ribosomal protein S18 acetylase RimI-like enzyme
MNSPVVVRRATPEDVALVAPLFALYRVFYGRTYDEPAAAAYLRERLERDQSVVLLAEPTPAPGTGDVTSGGTNDAGPVGFVQLYPGFESISLSTSWVLNDLYVLETARGSGVAAALMEEAERLARQAGAVSLTLETAHDNVVAQRLYERQGYRVDDAYLHYEKPLS